MRGIPSLIRKDFFTIRVLLGVGLALYLAAWIAFSLFISTMAILYGIIIVFVMVLTLFGAEDNQQMSDINHILPVSRSNVVVARYLFAWIISLVVSGVTAILICLRALHTNDFIDVIPLFAQLAASSLLIINFTFPVIYRFGIQKARLYCMIVYMLVIMSSTGLQSYLTIAMSSILASGSLIMPAFLLMMILLSPVSMYLSRRWYNKR